MALLVMAAILTGAAYGAARLVASKADASAHYSVQINGGMPKVQSSGVPIVLTFTVRNTGSAIPDYAVQFTGLDHWIVDDVSSGTDPGIIAAGPNLGYAFGPLAAGASLTTTMNLAPRNVGRPTLSMTSYSTIAAGMPQVDAAAAIIEGGAVWSVVVKL